MSKYHYNARAANKIHKLVKEGPVVPQLHHFDEKDLNASMASASVLSAAKNQDDESYGRVPITLDLEGLGGKKMVFDGKTWAAENEKDVHEENNMLRFKIEVLLDLYASTRLDYLRLKEQVRAQQEQR